MNIRQFTEEDVPELYDIHRRFYEKEFVFPFGTEFRPLLDKFAVVDDSDKIISFGSLELSVEAIVITDKSREVNDRREALYKLMEALQWNARNHQFHHIHCTVQDDKWEHHLIKAGFKRCKGNYLYLPVT